MARQTKIPVKHPVKHRTGVLKAEPHKVTTVPRKAPTPAPKPEPKATTPKAAKAFTGDRTVTIKHVSTGGKQASSRGRVSLPGSGMLQGDAGLIVAGTVVATGLTVIHDLLKGEINMKPILGGFIVGIALLLIAFISVPIATALALLLVISSVLINAVPVLTRVMFS